MDAKCPLCCSDMTHTTPETALKPLGQKGRKMTIKVGEREIFKCGAVRLTNKDNPHGIVEAACCQTSKDAPTYCPPAFHFKGFGGGNR